jgi:hypothetical protein
MGLTISGLIVRGCSTFVATGAWLAQPARAMHAASAAHPMEWGLYLVSGLLMSFRIASGGVWAIGTFASGRL